MSPESLPAPGEERARYLTHRNDPSDQGYRTFLGRLCTPLVQRLTPGSRGLDFGSGPGPTLSVMLEEQGFSMAIYDPFFAPDSSVLDDVHDFVTCTETAEHFHFPMAEFALLDRLARPGGWIGIMTEMVDDAGPFGDWYYVRDPTHVAFYRRGTMEWIAGTFGWEAEFPHRNVSLFHKRTAGLHMGTAGSGGVAPC